MWTRSLKLILRLLICLIILAPITFGADINIQQVQVGVLANKGKPDAIISWQPLMDYLGETIPDYNFNLVPLGFAEVYQESEAGNLDFLITNTGQYIELETACGMSRIATFRNAGPKGFYTKFGGVLFVRGDNDQINSIADFPGQRILVADAHSFGGWLMQLREIKAQGVEPQQFADIISAGNHELVVSSVLEGSFEIGAVRTNILEDMVEAGKLDLALVKIINPQEDISFPFQSSTRLYPEWPFAKANHTDSLLAKDVVLALLTLPEDSIAAKAAKSGGWTIPEDYSPAHELFRDLQMGPYQELGKFSLADVLNKYWQIISLSLLLFFVAGFSAIWISTANKRLQTTLDDLNISHQELKRLNALLIENMEYARIIQESLLPDLDELSRLLPDWAVLWEPLEIVGGDYYRIEEIDGQVFILLADCTGHGVPGALVTMVLSASLDLILYEEKTLDPELLLIRLDQAVRKRLRQDAPTSTSDDGLEAAVCIYNPSSQILSYAGAGLPLLWFQDNHAHVLKADRAHLGSRTQPPKNKFTVHQVPVSREISFYLFTDGITNQMSSTTKQLFGRQRLIDLISGMGQVSLKEQIIHIKEALQNYRQDEEVRDDQTMIAFRL